jgi:hypothetical protein
VYEFVSQFVYVLQNSMVAAQYTVGMPANGSHIRGLCGPADPTKEGGRTVAPHLAGWCRCVSRLSPTSTRALAAKAKTRATMTSCARTMARHDLGRYFRRETYGVLAPIRHRPSLLLDPPGHARASSSHARRDNSSPCSYWKYPGHLLHATPAVSLISSLLCCPYT